MKKDKFDKACEDLGNTLYEMYTAEENEAEGMGNYLLERSKSLFYGRLVEDKIPKFLELYDLLLKNNHTSEEDSYMYGDIDYFIWIEFCKEDPTKKIIATKNNRICRDNNYQLFIFKENTIKTTLLARNVWPEEVKESDYWKDHRDIKIPSLKTYRDYNFSFGCGDARDIGNAFSYEKTKYTSEEDTIKVDYPQWHENEIIFSLNNIDQHYSAVSGKYKK